MPSIRTFIALPTSADVQQQMSDIQAQLKNIQADVKWESRDKFHITIKFLGSTEQTAIESISSSLAKIAQKYSTFELQYQLLGVFPSLQNPRIVWIGTQTNKVVMELQSDIEGACSEFGFAKEERTFHPHITLGRVKGTRNLVRLTDAIKTITFQPMQSRCSEVLLMKSDLRPGGSIYTILKSFPLQP